MPFFRWINFCVLFLCHQCWTHLNRRWQVIFPHWNTVKKKPPLTTKFPFCGLGGECVNPLSQLYCVCGFQERVLKVGIKWTYTPLALNKRKTYLLVFASFLTVSCIFSFFLSEIACFFPTSSSSFLPLSQIYCCLSILFLSTLMLGQQLRELVRCKKHDYCIWVLSLGF